MLLARCHLEAALVWRGGAEVSLGSPRLPPQNVLPGLGTHGAGRGQALCPTAASVQPSRAIFAIIIWDFLFFSPNFAAASQGGCAGRVPVSVPGRISPSGDKTNKLGVQQPQGSRAGGGLQNSPPPTPAGGKTFSCRAGAGGKQGPFHPLAAPRPHGHPAPRPAPAPAAPCTFSFFLCPFGFVFIFFSPFARCKPRLCLLLPAPPRPSRRGGGFAECHPWVLLALSLQLGTPPPRGPPHSKAGALWR